MLSTAPNELKNGTGSITSPATVTFAFPNMTANSGYCKGDPVKVTVNAHYSFLSFLIGQGALPARLRHHLERDHAHGDELRRRRPDPRSDRFYAPGLDRRTPGLPVRTPRTDPEGE